LWKSDGTGGTALVRTFAPAPGFEPGRISARRLLLADDGSHGLEPDERWHCRRTRMAKDPGPASSRARSGAALGSCLFSANDGANGEEPEVRRHPKEPMLRDIHPTGDSIYSFTAW
jgi:hypothetical protein